MRQRLSLQSECSILSLTPQRYPQRCPSHVAVLLLMTRRGRQRCKTTQCCQWRAFYLRQLFLRLCRLLLQGRLHRKHFSNFSNVSFIANALDIITIERTFETCYLRSLGRVCWKYWELRDMYCICLLLLVIVRLRR